MSTIATTDRPNVQEMAVVHRVFRREFPALSCCVRSTLEGDVDRAAVVAHQALAEWRADASAVRGEQLARVVDELTDGLVEHLDLEEREVLPLVTRHVTAAEWNLLGEHGRRTTPLRRVPIVFGALLEAAPEVERGHLLAGLPRSVRWYVTTQGARTYRRHVTRLRQG